MKQVDHAFDEVANKPTQDNITRLRDLFDLQRVISGKRAWSFGVGELLTLIGTAVIPLILFILNYWFGGSCMQGR